MATVWPPLLVPLRLYAVRSWVGVRADASGAVAIGMAPFLLTRTLAKQVAWPAAGVAAQTRWACSPDRWVRCGAAASAPETPAVSALTARAPAPRRAARNLLLTSVGSWRSAGPRRGALPRPARDGLCLTTCAVSTTWWDKFSQYRFLQTHPSGWAEGRGPSQALLGASAS